MAGGQKGKLGGAILHGHASNRGTREYRCWLSMRRRCKRDKNYIGIAVHPDWQASFQAFLRDVGPAPSSTHTLDRYPNPTGNYEPNNVRWATAKEQRHNRRPDAKVARPWLGKTRAPFGASKLTAPEVRAIRTASAAGETNRSIAKRFNVTPQAVWGIVTRRTWADLQ